MKLAFLLVSASMLFAADLRIDHVTVAGTDLARMQQQLRAAGINSEPGGPHSNHATAMAIANFNDGSYIELIAPQKDFDAAALKEHPWGSLIEGNSGPCAWAVRPKDFEGEVARIRASGTPVKVQQGGRSRPDGIALQWETATPEGGASGTFLPFLIRDIFARPQRAFPSGKAINKDQTGVLRVVIAVRKISDAVDRFHAAYPDTGHVLKQVDAQFGAQLAWFPDSPVIFAEPAGSQSRVADRIAQFGEGPCAFILASKKMPKGEHGTTSRWFGRDVQWLHPEELGWRLGVQVE